MQETGRREEAGGRREEGRSKANLPQGTPFDALRLLRAGRCGRLQGASQGKTEGWGNFKQKRLKGEN